MAWCVVCRMSIQLDAALAMRSRSLRQARLAHAIDQARERAGILEWQTLVDTLHRKSSAHPQQLIGFGLGLRHALLLGVGRRQKETGVNEVGSAADHSSVRRDGLVVALH